MSEPGPVPPGPVPPEPVPRGALTVRGGPGGTRARLDDLEHAGRRLRAAGDVMAAVAVRAGRVAADPGLAITAALSPLTWAGVEGRLVRAVGPPAGAFAVAARLTALGTAAGGAGVCYRTADAAVDVTMHAVDVAVGRAVGTLVAVPLAAAVVWAPLSALGGTAAVLALGAPDPVRRPGLGPGLDPGPGAPRPGGGRGAVLLAFLARHTGLVEHGIDGLPAAVGGVLAVVVPGLPGTGVPVDVPGAAGWLGHAGSAGGWLRESGEVRVVARREVPVTAPAGLADVLGGVGTLDPDRGAAPGTVRVIAVRRPDGRRAWIVQVPGTQNWSPRAGGDPLDLTGNVHVMAGEPTAARRLVVSALRSAGAGDREPVLLAGHSQGGIVAAQLAADPAFRASFHVTHVVTAGSPVAAVRVPDSVAVLALEHDEDLIPRLDGDENPDRAGWVTVSRSTTSEAGSPDPSVAHGLGSYTRTAAAVDADPDPGLAAWRQGLRPFLAGDGVTATGVEVTGVRTSSTPGRRGPG